MALYHFHVDQIKRSAGQSAIAAAAYRAGEKLYSEYYGESNDFTRKGGVLYTEILLPPNAPPEYADRQTLWNAVEKVEKNKKAQLAYSFDIALQNELTQEENIALARRFVQEHFVSKGMIADLAVHEPDKENDIQNPHFQSNRIQRLAAKPQPGRHLGQQAAGGIRLGRKWRAHPGREGRVCVQCCSHHRLARA